MTRDFYTKNTSALSRYTIDEINAMIDESERQIAAGLTVSDDESFRKYEFLFEEFDEVQLEAV